MNGFVNVLLRILFVISAIGTGLFTAFGLYEQIVGSAKLEELFKKLHIPLSFNQYFIIGIICMAIAYFTYGSVRGIKTSPENKSLNDLVTKVYSAEQLSDITEVDGSINELNKLYPVECLRRYGKLYKVFFLGDGEIAIITFDDSFNKVFGEIKYLEKLKADFSVLNNGNTLKDVQAIDPNGEYLFLYTGRNDTPKVSSHYTKDGYMITVEYDSSNVIVGINEELI